MPYQSRPADAGDAVAIARLIERVFVKQLASELEGAARVAFRMYVTSAALRNRLMAGSLAEVMTCEGAIVGFAELCDRRTGGSGHDHLALFFVDPDHQRVGVGRRLLNAIVRRAGSKTSTLTVNSSRRAEPVYRRLGFVRASEPTPKIELFSISMQLTAAAMRSLQRAADPQPCGQQA